MQIYSFISEFQKIFSFYHHFVREIVAYFVNLHKITVDMNFFRNILYLIISPRTGWEDVMKYHVPHESLQRKLLMPFLVLVALAPLAQFFYTINLGIIDVLQMMIADVIAIFLGCLISIYGYAASIGVREEEEADNFNAIYVCMIYTYILLGGISIIRRVLLPESLSNVLYIMAVLVGCVIYSGRNVFPFLDSEVADSMIVRAAIIGVAPFILFHFLFSFLF